MVHMNRTLGDIVLQLLQGMLVGSGSCSGVAADANLEMYTNCIFSVFQIKVIYFTFS